MNRERNTNHQSGSPETVLVHNLIHSGTKLFRLILIEEKFVDVCAHEYFLTIEVHAFFEVPNICFMMLNRK